MGPITLFDKSFLQALSVDESLWFDHFFLTNVCPLFYIETLADLEKSVKEGGTPEQEVGMIADKFPEMHGTPSIYHVQICVGSLMGNPIPLTGQIVIAGGRLVKVDGKSSAIVDDFPEAQAFNRWQKREYLEVERLFARGWREQLASLSLAELSDRLVPLGIKGETCKSLEEAKTIAENFVRHPEGTLGKLQFLLMILKLPYIQVSQILRRWLNAGRPNLIDYAPYAAYVLTIEVFFYLALLKSFISTDRPSNRVDINYLYYLPFCMVFVSGDSLHRRCVPLFLRNDQSFIWGPDLKQALKEINEYYSQLTTAEKEKGVMSFANCPPADRGALITRLYDRHLGAEWRDGYIQDRKAPIPGAKDMVEHINRLVKAPELSQEQVDFDPYSPESMVIKRVVHSRKGSWHQVPKDLPADNENKLLG